MIISTLFSGDRRLRVDQRRSNMAYALENKTQTPVMYAATVASQFQMTRRRVAVECGSLLEDQHLPSPQPPRRRRW